MGRMAGEERGLMIRDIGEAHLGQAGVGFFFFLRIYGARIEPVHEKVKGKTNHISFQNFHYEAAVDPSEHDNACPCDKTTRSQ